MDIGMNWKWHERWNGWMARWNGWMARLSRLLVPGSLMKCRTSPGESGMRSTAVSACGLIRRVRTLTNRMGATASQATLGEVTRTLDVSKALTLEALCGGWWGVSGLDLEMVVLEHGNAGRNERGCKRL